MAVIDGLKRFWSISVFHDTMVIVQIITKASMLAEFFFALAIGSGMSCVP